MAFQEIGRERGVAGHGVVAGVRGQIAEEIGIIAEQLVGDPAALDRAGGVGGFVLIVRAHVGPEGIRMADERGLRVGLQDLFERPGIAGAPGAFVREVIDFLEMNEERHAQIGGERIHAPQLRAVRGDVELQLAEALGSILDRLGELLFRIRLGHVVAAEPGEPARGGRLQRLHLFERRPTREQVGLRDPGPVEMREVGRRLRTEVEVKVEDRAPTRSRACPPSGAPARRPRPIRGIHGD